MTQEEFFTELYKKQFNDKQINQLIRIYTEGADASYFGNSIDVDELRKINQILKDKNEISEIYKDALKNKVDFIKFLHKEYDVERLRILLALEVDGINTDLILSPEFSDEQFNFLRKGLIKKLDISWFADETIPAEKMKIALKSSEKEIPMPHYIKRFSDKQLEVLYDALLYCKEVEAINVNFLDNPNFTSRQMQIILNGLKGKVDVSKYAFEKYSPDQMTIISNFLKEKIDITEFLDEKYSATQMLYYGNMAKIDKKIAIELLNPDFDDAQLSFLLDCIKTRKNTEKIKEIAKPEYSLQRMRLILNAKKENKELYKDLSITDQTLFLFDKGFIKNLSEKYEDIFDLEDVVSDTYKIHIPKRNKEPLFVSCEKNSYYTNGEDIIEITNVTDEYTREARNTDDLFFDVERRLVHEFGFPEVSYIIEKNIKKAQEFIDKYYYPYWDKETQTLCVVELFSGNKKNYKNPTLENLEPNKILSNFFVDTLPYAYAYEYTTPYEANSQLYDLLQNLEIDINEYFITENVYDNEGRILEKLCLNKEHLNNYKDFRGNPIDEREAQHMIEREAAQIEAMYNQDYFIMTIYDKKGRLIDDTPDVYTMRDVNDILKFDLSNPEELIGCTRLSDAVRILQKEFEEER